MELYEKKFWSAETFDEAFRKVSQYPLSQKEKYLRNMYISYRKLFGEMRKRQPSARKLLD